MMSLKGTEPAVKKEESAGDNEKPRSKGGKKAFRRYASYKPKFKGKTKSLEGFIYDVGVENLEDLFIKTTKEIAEYSGRVCTESLDIRPAIELSTEVTIVVPGSRNTGYKDVDKLLLSKDLYIFMKIESMYQQNKS